MSGIVLWIVWALIGICGGYMSSRLLLDGSKVVLLDIVGIAGALLAGWTFLSMIDPAPEQMEKMEIVSLVIAAAGAALCLWIAVWLLRRRGDSPDDE